MKKLIILSSLIFMAISIAFCPTNVNAEDFEYQVVGYITKAEFNLVPDVEGHAIGFYERRGVAIFQNGETGAYHTTGTFDYIKGNGKFQGYSTITYKDGSTSTSKYTGDMVRKPDQLPTYSGKGEYTKGTGKYEGIKGNFTYDAVYVTPYDKENKGDALIKAKGSYTLSK